MESLTTHSRVSGCHVTGRQSSFTCKVNSCRRKSSARVQLLRSELDAFQLSSLPEEPQGVSFTLPSLHAHTKRVCLRRISGIIYSLCKIQSVHDSFRATRAQETCVFTGHPSSSSILGSLRDKYAWRRNFIR